ncbi:iron transporter [Caldimonas brevitalea]|uniref:Iron transporter n=1 Tax=Caldimonas brevitalea TaxID=413882 RepID=A0A0G3BF75_9BURK|nr:iron transporter [Caldimonas brevitalea]
MEPVVVTGSRVEARVFDTPYAITVIDAATLRTAGPMVHLSEALTRVPGLLVQNRQNFAQDLQISSRGFGARSTFGVRGVRLYTDGIPATMPDGSGQVSHFDLAGAQRIEVLRGPFSALYGNSSGGVIALVTAPPRERRGVVAVDAGSDGSGQLRAGFETPLDGGWNVRAGVAGYTTDGPRPHSEARRMLGNLRLGWQGERDSVTLHANLLDQPADDPLGLTRAQFDQNPDQTTPQAEAFDTRKTAEQQQLGLSWRRRFDASALKETTLSAYLGHREVTQWQAIPVSAQQSTEPPDAACAPLCPPGGVIDLSRDYHGFDARGVWRWQAVQLIAGAAHERQQDTRRGYENFTGSGPDQRLGVTGALRRDEGNTATSNDVYAQAELTLAETLVATLGARHGQVRMSSSDHYLVNGDDSGERRFRYTNPVAGLQWRATPTLNLYASAGRGFESPTLNELAYRPDGAAGFNTSLQAQRSRQFELGVKWRGPTPQLAVDVALFRATTDDEIAVRSNTGGRSVFGNVGRTRRQGAELGLQWRWSAAWRTQAALTWLDATYRDDFVPGVPAQAGKRIAGTTPRSAFVDLAWHGAGPGREVALEWRGQGRMPVNDVNSDFAAGYGVWALRASYALAGAADKGVRLFARIDNLADRRYAGSVIVNESNGRFFEPAPGRTWWAGLEWSL